MIRILKTYDLIKENFKKKKVSCIKIKSPLIIKLTSRENIILYNTKLIAKLQYTKNRDKLETNHKNNNNLK